MLILLSDCLACGLTNVPAPRLWLESLAFGSIVNDSLAFDLNDFPSARRIAVFESF